MRKPVPAKTSTKRKKKSTFIKNNGGCILGLIFLILLAATAYHFRNGIAYYLGFKSHNALSKEEEKHLADVRNFELLNKYCNKVIGIDVSQYQEDIVWAAVRKVEDSFAIKFVFIRATIGNDKVDLHFNRNWFGSKHNKIIRGAYHYYRPDENSLEQAENFISHVKLEKGDLPPVLDIEKIAECQSTDSLKLGLRRWLEKVESHYHVKPIIYTGEKYYNAFLREEFSGYTFWIANYNFFVEDICDDWMFWQFTESASVKGIPCNVDLNIYNGSSESLESLRIH